MPNNSRAYLIPNLSLFSATTSSSALDFYVDPVNGSDTNPGTQAAPLQSLARAYELIPFFVLPTHYMRIHMRSGTYAAAVLGPKVLSAPIVHFADEAWDPTVYTQIAAGVGGAATAAGVVDVTALAPAINALRGAFVRFTSGAAAGQIRLVRDNTATSLFPAINFSPAPVPGDAYEVFTAENVQLDFSALPPGAGSQRPWIMGTSGFTPQGSLQVSAVGNGGAPVIFVGMRAVGAVTTFAEIVNADVAFYGFHSVNSVTRIHRGTLFTGHDGLGNFTLSGSPTAGIVASALGLPSAFTYLGFGATFDSGRAPFVDHTSQFHLIGNLNGAITWVGGYVFFKGGSAIFNSAVGGLNMLEGRLDIYTSNGSPGAPNPVVLQQGSARAVLYQQSQGSIRATINSQAGIAIQVHRMSHVALDDGATGESATGVSVSCKYGSIVVLTDGAPLFGRAVGNDYDIGDGAPQNKSFFAADGASMFNAASPHAGSLIIRQD